MASHPSGVLTTPLSLVSSAEGALNPAVYVFDEDTKHYWSQYGPLYIHFLPAVAMLLYSPPPHFFLF